MTVALVRRPPRTAAVTVTPAGSGCAAVSSASCRRCSLTLLSAGKADCRRIASRFSACSVLTEDLPSAGVGWAALPGGLAHVGPLPEYPCREGATTRLAPRQVRGRHQITVIRAAGPGGTEGLDGPDPWSPRP